MISDFKVFPKMLLRFGEFWCIVGLLFAEFWCIVSFFPNRHSCLIFACVLFIAFDRIGVSISLKR